MAAATGAPRRVGLSSADIAARATQTTVIGPGIVPKVEPQLTVQSAEFVRWSQTNVRRQKQPGFSPVTGMTPSRTLTLDLPGRG